MEILTIPTGPIEANCYILIKENSQDALVIDPGDNGDQLVLLIEKLGLHVQAILLTHSHFDHIGAVDDLVSHFGCEVYINPAEAEFLKDSTANSSNSFDLGETIVRAHAKALKEGLQKIGDFEVDAIFSPGHSIGSTMFLIGKDLFSGDVLFKGSIGRTDLPTGNADEMAKTLERIKAFSQNYTVYPGHGPATTLEFEKVYNPFLNSSW